MKARDIFHLIIIFSWFLCTNPAVAESLFLSLNHLGENHDHSEFERAHTTAHHQHSEEPTCPQPHECHSHHHAVLLSNVGIDPVKRIYLDFHPLASDLVEHSEPKLELVVFAPDAIGPPRRDYQYSLFPTRAPPHLS